MKLTKIALHWQILIALILSLIAGMFFPSIVPYIDWIGILFIKTLKNDCGSFNIYFFGNWGVESR
ncbi:hypothetical protein OAO55_03010 [Bacteroidales bacterium]|nr:hypothetical protein [Bacteroidales bacterium]